MDKQLTLFDTTEIGSEAYAEIVNTMDAVKEGFEYLDKGSYRQAFLGPDGVVYKKDLYSSLVWPNGLGSNKFEANTLKDLRRRSFEWVPQFHLFDNGILAMQYLEDVPSSDWDTDEVATEELSSENRSRVDEIITHVNDSHSANIGISPKDGLIYIRDAGHGSS